MAMFEGKKTCLIVVGASRGLGKTIALEFSRTLVENSICFIFSRTIESLEDVKTEILQTNPLINVVTHAFDQGELCQSSFDTLFSSVLLKHIPDCNCFDQAILVHNSGTLGDNTKFVHQFNDVDVVRKNFDINISGMVLINALFLKLFPNEAPRRYIVQMTSLAGVKAFPSLSLYCSGKAARDMFMKCVAEENPSIRVLNYAPGPCDTDMFNDFAYKSADPGVQQVYQKMKAGGDVLSCSSSIKKLMKILTEDKYESGAHVDYFDVE